MNKSNVWAKIEAFRREKASKERFPYTKIVWLQSLFNRDEPEKSIISKKDYDFIESCRYRQNERQKVLSKESLKICDKIYERYQKASK